MVRVDRHNVGPDDTPPIAALAAAQFGVVSREQLVRAGVSTAVIDGWVRRGRLFLLHRGVYAVGHLAVGLRGRELAAVFAAGEGALLSHQSAGGLCRMRPPWLGTIQVVAPRARKLPGIQVHRARSIAPEDRACRGPIPLTSPARTLLDLAEVLPDGELLDALSEAVRLNLAHRAALEDVIDRSPGRRGGPILAELLDDLHPTRSRLEREFLRLVKVFELPRPIVNGRVNGYEVDAHWPEHRLVVEVDGFEHHGTRRAFETDRERDAELQATGWRVVRITFLMLCRAPGKAAALIRRALALQPATPRPSGSILASTSPGVSPA